jgi:hypothetical protein
VRHLLALSRNRDRVVHKIKRDAKNLPRVGQHDKSPASGEANLKTFRRGRPQQVGDLDDRLDDIEATPPVRRIWLFCAIASLHMAAARDMSVCAATAISRPREPERRSSVSRCKCRIEIPFLGF